MIKSKKSLGTKTGLGRLWVKLVFRRSDNIFKRLQINDEIIMMRRFLSVPARCYLPREVVAERVSAVLSSSSSTSQSFANNPMLSGSVFQHPQNILPDRVHFVADLELDSLKRKVVVKRLADEFCVALPPSAAGSIMDVGAAVDYFSTHPKAR